MPTLLNDVDAKNAYDRLAAGSFAKGPSHTYAQRTKESQKVTFSDQARK